MFWPAQRRSLKPNLARFNLHYYTLDRESWTELAVILALHLLRHRLLFSKGFCHVRATSSIEVLLPQAQEVVAGDERTQQQHEP